MKNTSNQKRVNKSTVKSKQSSSTKKTKVQKSILNNNRIRIAGVAVVAGFIGLASMLSIFAAKPSPKDDPINYIVAISIDGLRPDAISKLGKAKTPNLHAVIRGGASTMNARNDYNVSVTLPNHTSMLTGRPVTAAGGHRVTVNNDTGSTVHQFAKKKVFSVFDVVHDRGGRTELVAMKDKFNLIDRSWNKQNGAVDTTGKNNGRDKIDAYYLNENERAVTNFANRLTKSPSKFSFLHIRYPDSAGHKYGFMSKKYLAAVQQSDRQIGKVLRAINKSKRLRAHMAVIITSDHGGTGKSHTNPRIATNYRVPFMVMGPNIPKGVNLYDLNKKTRRAPGNARVSYTGAQPIRNSDVANLATDLLDLPSVPGSTVNKKQNLNVFK